MVFKQNYRYIDPYNYLDAFSSPQWYLKLEKELKEFFYNYDGTMKKRTQQWKDKRAEFVTMIAELLENEKIALGTYGSNFDRKRLPIDTIVIHHTSTPANTPIMKINALGLIRLYAPEYSQKDSRRFGKAIWSNHFYKGKPTFIAYHYIVKRDGTYEQVLKDEYIGWHCGDWNYNCRSIAICFLDGLLDRVPSKKAIQTAKEIIKKYPNCKVLGHREISSQTICPGNLFLGQEGWGKLLKK